MYRLSRSWSQEGPRISQEYYEELNDLHHATHLELATDYETAQNTAEGIWTGDVPYHERRKRMQSLQDLREEIESISRIATSSKISDTKRCLLLTNSMTSSNSKVARTTRIHGAWPHLKYNTDKNAINNQKVR